MHAPPSSQVAGLEAVFLELRPELERRARAMGAAGDADDVLQDVWLKLRASGGPVANPRAYLHRMVYTAVLDRKRGRLRSAARDNAWIETTDPVEIQGAGPAEAERALVARQTLAVVEARLAALGDPAAMIFRRHRIDGETQRQVAEALGMGLSTVEKHLRRAYAVIVDLGEDQP